VAGKISRYANDMILVPLQPRAKLPPMIVRPV